MKTTKENEIAKKWIKLALPSMSDVRFARCFSIYLDLRASGDSHSEAVQTIKCELMIESIS